VDDAGAGAAAAIDTARKHVTDAMALLDTLLAVKPTLERESLYGSAYKRLAMIEAKAGNTAAEEQAIEKMWEHYGKAEDIAQRAGSPRFYPAMNRIAAQLARTGARKNPGPLDTNAIRASMRAAAPDFWTVVGQTELDMYVSIAAGTLAKKVAGLVADFSKHHERVSSLRMWSSVLDNATFVLSRYMRRAAAAEAAAAQQLLDVLGKLAPKASPEADEPKSERKTSARKRTSRKRRVTKRSGRAATRTPRRKRSRR
jgi:hypothetical protein